MEHYVAIDVSVEESSVCIVDATGRIIREVKIASAPEALVRYFDELELSVIRIGLEAGPLRHLGPSLIDSGEPRELLLGRGGSVEAARGGMPPAEYEGRDIDPSVGS